MTIGQAGQGKATPFDAFSGQGIDLRFPSDSQHVRANPRASG